MMQFELCIKVQWAHSIFTATESSGATLSFKLLIVLNNNYILCCCFDNLHFAIKAKQKNGFRMQIVTKASRNRPVLNLLLKHTPELP